ncbi:hypothetical protein [Agrobacterium sp. NPDC090283]|uniref:hypothetical protein n=1 Tax=Agrobacterium sp. NPDC090283 TaxID=3363920 RepID=UPI00383A8C61
MKLFRVVDEDQAWLASQPETAMGIQIVRRMGAFPDNLFFILGGQVAFRFRDYLPDDGEGTPLNLDGGPWARGDNPFDAPVNATQQFLAWIGELDELPQTITGFSVLPRVEFTLFPIGPFPQPPQPNSWTYGHLPFAGTTGTQEVYYRWEPWPVSRRIDQTGGIIAPDTFTAPMSEVQFMPTGFSAVARLALPQLLPACYRWEIRPPTNTPMRCGASVPMFGQSGGGVEVAFPNGFSNVGPIANPVVLSPL